jgi:tetratricopeptide (TPR) repeat protein
MSVMTRLHLSKILFTFVFAAILHWDVSIAAEKPADKIIESGWVSQSDLEILLKKRAESRFMLFKVIGKKGNQDLLFYKASFKPFPQDLDHFYAYWGMTNAWYKNRKNALESEGFQEIWHQSFKDAAETELHQAVWLKASKNEPDIPQITVMYKDEEHERNILLAALFKHQYKNLDQSLDIAYSNYRLGTLPSNYLSGRFDALANADAEFGPRFDDWVRTTHSGYAHLARGMYLQQQAWAARGAKFASKTSKAQFAKMEGLARRAQVDLLRANVMLTACALCSGELIAINRALNQHESDDELLKTALKQDPKMWSPVLTYFWSLFPQWGGSYEQMESFMVKMRNRTEDQGLIDQLTSRLYWVHGSFEQEEDQESARIWYEQGVNAHPYPLLINELALIYSKRNNYAKAAELLEKSLVANNEWDIYTLEALAQAYFSMGQQVKGEKMIAKRNESQRRYMNGE